MNVCDSYFRGDIQQVNHTFEKIVEILDLFIQLVSGIQHGLVLNVSGRFIKSDRVKNLEIHLLYIMKSLVKARKKNDLSMLCDLLKYELIDNLKTWKTLVIPQMKKSIWHKENWCDALSLKFSCPTLFKPVTLKEKYSNG